MATLTVFASFDGQVGITNYLAGIGDSFTTVRGLADGNDESDTGTAELIGIGSSTVSDLWVRLGRGFLVFDTSGLPDTVSSPACDFNLYVTANSSNQFAAGDFPITVVSNTQASASALTTADYDQLGTTSFANTLPFASIIQNSYNVFTFNTAGKAAINSTGNTKIGLRFACDVSGSSPTWASNKTMEFQFKTSNTAGTTQDPKLVITYTVGTPVIIGGGIIQF